MGSRIQLTEIYAQCTVSTRCTKRASTNGGQRFLLHLFDRGAEVLGLGYSVSALCPFRANDDEVDIHFEQFPTVLRCRL